MNNESVYVVPTSLVVDQRVLCMARNDKTIVAGFSAPGHVCTSDDDGITWSDRLYASYMDYATLCVVALKSGTFLAGSKGPTCKLWRSLTTEGMEWTPVRELTEPNVHWVHDPVAIVQQDDGTVLCLTKTNGWVYRSTDDGCTWFRSYAFGRMMNHMVHLGGSILLASAMDEDWFYRSADGGASWTRVGPDEREVRHATLFRIPETSVVLAAVGPKMWHSWDLGLTWEPDCVISDAKLVGGRAMFVYTNDILFMATTVSNKVVHSFDMGITWHPTLELEDGSTVRSLGDTKEKTRLLVGTGPRATIARVFIDRIRKPD